jgi:hypothetical protein
MIDWYYRNRVKKAIQEKIDKAVKDMHRDAFMDCDLIVSDAVPEGEIWFLSPYNKIVDLSWRDVR